MPATPPCFHLSAIVLGVALAFAANSRAETVYSWRDADGVPQLTTEAPSTGVPYSRRELPDPVRWSNNPAMPEALDAGRPIATQDLYKGVSRSVYLVRAAIPGFEGAGQPERAGTAVAISEHQALTNCHIVGSPEAEVSLSDNAGKTWHDARLVAANFLGDRCVLEVRDTDLVPVPGLRRFDAVEVGETVYAVGNPRLMNRSLSEGVISGKRDMNGRHYIQTTAAISHGSSGGGLFDAQGNLLGITSFAIRGAQDLNFAIAADDFWQ